MGGGVFNPEMIFNLSLHASGNWSDWKDVK